MKKLILGSLLALVGLAGCVKDNFDAPQSNLTGQVVYNNLPVGVRSNGVQLELWQHGYAAFTKVPVYVDQDGSFSATLFDGDYKLVLLRGNGPWVANSDTIQVNLRGNMSVNVPVTPYYTVGSATYTKNGNTITATTKINQVVASQAIERVTFYLGATQFVDINNNAARVDLTGTALADLSKNLTLTLNVPNNLGKAYAYGRIGVKTAGVGEMLYSPVQEIKW
ncbi:hypothetical protein BWI96_08160 [Siphonobacter sp. SORGH_AS_0500]|uniref:DUF3823 domain-containing protein n=1 Tax=Siphonobacter sp. SORGH_AS_0500 TaxID=1864824 RepID=UPI000CC8EE85|nr:DUF3823 domain-containing protein [Siphonobacter sp. SORGH_AS_0500]PKK36865.1 hypothetical protein BWI96_08160 [Siphonobacter sp. SORGH_AS_0500]